MQITPKLLTLVKIFDSLNHSFNFYWQNNDSKNIHSKKNLIIHSSKIFIQKKKNYSFKKNSFKKKTEYSFKKNIHSKVFLIIHSMKIFIFLKNAVSPTPRSTSFQPPGSPFLWGGWETETRGTKGGKPSLHFFLLDSTFLGHWLLWRQFSRL